MESTQNDLQVDLPIRPSCYLSKVASSCLSVYSCTALPVCLSAADTQDGAMAAAIRQLQYEENSFNSYSNMRSYPYETISAHDHFYAWVPHTGD